MHTTMQFMTGKGLRARKKIRIGTNIHLDSDIEKQAKDIFKKYGISLNDAINIFLTQSILQKGFPFELKIPNSETIKAIEDARIGKNSEEISLDDLKQRN